MKTKHTPGPWSIDSKTSGEGPIVRSSNKQAVALVFNSTGGMAANAHLISAAPEMLDALNAFLVYFYVESANGTEFNSQTNAFIEQAAFAVNKAMGEA